MTPPAAAESALPTENGALVSGVPRYKSSWSNLGRSVDYLTDNSSLVKDNIKERKMKYQKSSHEKKITNNSQNAKNIYRISYNLTPGARRHGP